MNAFTPIEIIPAIAEKWAELQPRSSAEIMRIINARRDLERDVEKRRNSFEVIDYRKRRAAALKGLGRTA